MNKVKPLGLLGRLRAAGRAFQGKPADHITIGVEVKHCSDCERGDCNACGYKVHSEGVSQLPDCNDCNLRGHCEFEPELGDWTRINCPLHL